MTDTVSDPGIAKWGNYFDLLSRSAHFGGKLVGESEFAYSTFGFPALSDHRPLMSRWGISGSWGKLGYGAFYRTFGSGFVSTTGATVEHARDEKQVWGEYDFEVFRLKSAYGESRAKNSATSQLLFTRTAAASLRFSKPSWMALLSSSYSVLGQPELSALETHAVTNGLSFVYRPAAFLTLEPKVGFKQEWDLFTGLKADTPSAGFGLVCSPYRDLKLTTRASYARGLNEDPLKEFTTVNSATSLNWKIGRSILGEQTLSFHVEYKNESHANSDAPQENLTAMIQFGITRF